MNYMGIFFNACLKGDIYTVQRCIDVGLDINMMDESQITAIYIACQKGNTRLVELLLDYGAKINVKTIHNKTPLHLAVIRKDYEMTNLLIKRNANLNIKDKDGNTPLHIACINGDIKMVSILLEKNYSVNEKSKMGNTALHYACNIKNEELVEMLIKNGVNLDEKNYSGKTPIDIACCNGFTNIVDLLIKEGANIPLNVINWAIQREEFDIIKSVARRKDMAKYLIKKLIVLDKKHILREVRKDRININSMEEIEEQSLLELAINNKNVDIANILMSYNFGGINSTIQKLIELLNNNKVNEMLEKSTDKESNIIRVNKREKENNNILELLIKSRL